MKRVTGIGGLFFKCRDPERIKEWYKKHLGLPVDNWGATFTWKDKDKPERTCHTAWSPFPADTRYFEPSTREFMFNYRVDNLELLLEVRLVGLAIWHHEEHQTVRSFAALAHRHGGTLEDLRV